MGLELWAILLVTGVVVFCVVAVICAVCRRLCCDTQGSSHEDVENLTRQSGHERNSFTGLTERGSSRSNRLPTTNINIIDEVGQQRQQERQQQLQLWRQLQAQRQQQQQSQQVQRQQNTLQWKRTKRQQQQRAQLQRLLQEGNQQAATESKQLDLHNFSLKDAMEVFKVLLAVCEADYKEGGFHRKDRFINVITGRGKHSPNGVPIIKPAVANYLDMHDYSYGWNNPGKARIDLKSKTDETA